ncbi:LuxR C-terminal-related transcriptional regulator [Streptomyces sp. NPDC059850]|uniref:LuxR C-terminal-related transcriptional regulator n=1 Tax=Streptomyces sp. NPDC059850 TaxID=3346970 RepID=UPI00365C75BB
MTSRQPGYRELSPREREVLRLIADGNTTKQAARAMKVAPATAQRHLVNVSAKLGTTKERAAMVHRAYTLGQLDPPEHSVPISITKIPPAERDILNGLANGWSLAEVVASKGLYLLTARDDERTLKTRLGATNTAHLITRAWQLRLLGPESTSTPNGPATHT